MSTVVDTAIKPTADVTAIDTIAMPVNRRISAQLVAALKSLQYKITLKTELSSLHRWTLNEQHEFL